MIKKIKFQYSYFYKLIIYLLQNISITLYKNLQKKIKNYIQLKENIKPKKKKTQKKKK